MDLTPDHQTDLEPTRTETTPAESLYQLDQATNTDAANRPSFLPAAVRQRGRDLALRREQTRHRAAVARAANLLQTLPEPGETIHLVMRGAFQAFDLFAGLLRLAYPVRVELCAVATFGFNARTARLMAEQLDSGQIKKACFLGSLMFGHTHPDAYATVREVFTSRGHVCGLARNHAKVIAARLEDGRGFAFAGSANLQRCRNIETFDLAHDRQLADFHLAWILEAAELSKV